MAEKKTPLCDKKVAEIIDVLWGMCSDLNDANVLKIHIFECMTASTMLLLMHQKSYRNLRETVSDNLEVLAARIHDSQTESTISMLSVQQSALDALVIDSSPELNVIKAKVMRDIANCIRDKRVLNTMNLRLVKPTDFND